jgi:hypothetical protein
VDVNRAGQDEETRGIDDLRRPTVDTSSKVGADPLDRAAGDEDVGLT